MSYLEYNGVNRYKIILKLNYKWLMKSIVSKLGVMITRLYRYQLHDYIRINFQMINRIFLKIRLNFVYLIY